jgi:hypothetical protein
VSGEFPIGNFPPTYDIAILEDEDVVIVHREDWGQNKLIAGSRYDAFGAFLGRFEISVGTGQNPEVASDADGDFVVVWQDSTISPTDVLAREFDGDGTPRQPPFQVNTYFPFPFQYSAIASDESGNYVVIWGGRDGGRAGIAGQRFASPDLHLSVDGTCPGPVTVSIVNAPPNSEVALIAAANTNGFVKGGSLCPGVELEIGEPFQLPPGFVIVDGNGRGSTSLTLGANRCHVQALALQSCETSNVAEVP